MGGGGNTVGLCTAVGLVGLGASRLVGAAAGWPRLTICFQRTARAARPAHPRGAKRRVRRSEPEASESHESAKRTSPSLIPPAAPPVDRRPRHGEPESSLRRRQLARAAGSLPRWRREASPCGRRQPVRSYDLASASAHPGMNFPSHSRNGKGVNGFCIPMRE